MIIYFILSQFYVLQLLTHERDCQLRSSLVGPFWLQAPWVITWPESRNFWLQLWVWLRAWEIIMDKKGESRFPPAQPLDRQRAMAAARLGDSIHPDDSASEVGSTRSWSVVQGQAPEGKAPPPVPGSSRYQVEGVPVVPKPPPLGFDKTKKAAPASSSTPLDPWAEEVGQADPDDDDDLPEIPADVKVGSGAALFLQLNFHKLSSLRPTVPKGSTQLLRQRRQLLERRSNRSWNSRRLVPRTRAEEVCDGVSSDLWLIHRTMSSRSSFSSWAPKRMRGLCWSLTRGISESAPPFRDGSWMRSWWIARVAWTSWQIATWSGRPLVAITLACSIWRRSTASRWSWWEVWLPMPQFPVLGGMLLQVTWCHMRRSSLSDGRSCVKTAQHGWMSSSR